MQKLAIDRRVFWCSGCGTLKEESGDHTRIEMPSNLRHVLQKADLAKGRENVSQSRQVDATFVVRQKDLAHPTIEMAIFGTNGKREF
jgi:hypothetical protein